MVTQIKSGQSKLNILLSSGNIINICRFKIVLLGQCGMSIICIVTFSEMGVHTCSQVYNISKKNCLIYVPNVTQICCMSMPEIPS